jgi:hypothetical protein
MVRDSEAGSLDPFYEIRVRSELDEAWSEWFTGLRPRSSGEGDTVLAGRLDQPALHAVLRRIRDLGLPLICVRRVDDGPEPATSNDTTEEQA